MNLFLLGVLVALTIREIADCYHDIRKISLKARQELRILEVTQEGGAEVIPIRKFK